MGWVRLHPVNIAARVQIVVEHFRQNVAHLLGGRAKAMVVTASRKEAVRWMLATRLHPQEGLPARPAGGLLRRREGRGERAGRFQ